MGRRSFFISVLSFGALLLCFSDSKELNREVTCYHDSLHVDCGESSIIAIHQAYFTSQRQENQTSCRSLLEHEYIEDEEHEQAFNNHSYCYEDTRIAINKRCSGLNNCTFSYSSEIERRCSNPDGVLIVQYDCVRMEKINKYCNAKVTASEGYIMQPGYPKYYPSFAECSWSLSAAEGQTILVKILHLHLSAATEITPTVSEHDSIYALSIGQLTEQITQCDRDSLSVLEGNVKRFSMCGEDLGNLKTFEADASNELVLKFKATEFSPTNGFLAYYKIQGCPDMPAGENSYLVQRNGTAAIYACRDGLVFNDTLENKRFLYCIRNHHWSNTLSSCIKVVEETTQNSISHITAIEQIENSTNFSNETVESLEMKPNFTEDILVPWIIISVLLIGNTVILLIIFLLRRKKKTEDNKKEVEIEEETELQPTNNPIS